MTLAQSALRPALVVRTVHHVERFEDPYLAACQRRSVVEAERLFVVSRLTGREVLAEYERHLDLLRPQEKKTSTNDCHEREHGGKDQCGAPSSSGFLAGSVRRAGG